MFFPTPQHVNLPACSPQYPINAERQAGKLVNTNFTVIGLTRHGINTQSTAAEADALATRPSELSKIKSSLVYTRGIAPKRVTGGGDHLRGLHLGNPTPKKHSALATLCRVRPARNQTQDLRRR